MTKLKDNSGCKLVFIPKESKIKVYIGPLGEKKTKGGIILLHDNVSDQAYKQTHGTLLEIKHFSKEDQKKCDLKIGDVVRFISYAGIHIEGPDNHAYRILQGYEIHSVDI